MINKNIIALVFDSDKTLTPDYMQAPLFKHFGIKSEDFWTESDNFVKLMGGGNDGTAFLNMMLKYVQEGKFKNLTNKLLRDLGSEIEFFQGLPEFFPNLKKEVETENLTLEYYVITSGLKEMILGSKIAPYMKEVYGSRFFEENGKLTYVVPPAISFTEKTRYLFKINKGVEDVNQKIPQESKRIPFTNIIYVGDGPTDVPCFDVVRSKRGKAFCVYDPLKEKAKMTALRIKNEGRVNEIGPADYNKNSATYDWLVKSVKDIISGF